MTKQEARYLTRAVESLAKETGDYVSDHLFATLRHQFEKGTSRTKAVKFAKNLFHKREAVGRMYDYLDDAARAALYELVEAEDVLQEEIEQLGKIAQTYQAEAGKALTKTQLDDLLGDSTLGEKSVEEVVAGLRAADKVTIKYRELKTYTAEEANQWFIDSEKPDFKPPYKPGTEVKEIRLTEDTVFARVYDNLPNGSGMKGGWIMNREDIEGLTPIEIRDKYALPSIPKYVCDVELKAGTRIRMGIVNPIEGWGSGGAIQYDLMRQRVGEFKNERLLEVN